MKLEITADKVKEAAAKCPQAEATLKTLFPEVFEGDKYFNFGDLYEISTNSTNAPFFIGVLYAPNYLMRKCLIMADGWDAIVRREGCKTIIVPFKK